jgi:hypothetical protein
MVGALLAVAILPTLAAVPRLVQQVHPDSPATTATNALVPSPAAPTVTGDSSPATAKVGNIRMFSQEAGWAQRLADGTILHTMQGDQGWMAANPPTAGRVLAAAYLDSRSAIALTVPEDPFGAVVIQTWSTADGGARWVRRGTLLVGVISDKMESVVFDNSQEGWFTIDEAATGFHGMLVYHTADGGAHWVEAARTING